MVVMINCVKVKVLDTDYIFQTIVIDLTLRNSCIVRLCAVIVASIVHLIVLASLFQTIPANSLLEIDYDK